MAIAALCFAAPASAYPGDLDTSFNSTGFVFTDFPGAQSDAADLAVQDDGKIVVVGTYGGSAQFAVARYDPDGTLDETFGTGGLVTTPMGLNDDTVLATSVVIQPDGKIVVGGTARVDTGTPPNGAQGFALARYLPNGDLDPAFGSGGRAFTVMTGLGADFCSGTVLNALALHGGNIYAAGGRACQGQDGPFVARYLPGGTLDPTYGPGGPDGINGVAHTDSHSNGAVELIVTSGGSAIVAGRAYGFQGSSIARFDPNGEVDSGFGSGGVVARPNEIVSLVPAPDDRFYTLTRFGFERRLSISRFLAADGALDSAFASGGTVETQFPPGNGPPLVVGDLARDSDGRLVTATYTETLDENGDLFHRVVLHRWTPGGVFDTHFGVKGESATVGDMNASAIVIDGSNRPLVAGGCRCDPNSFALARWLGGPGANRDPTASFTFTPSQPSTDEGMLFDASASSDLDGPIVNYRWDLDGSGNFATDSGSSPTLSGVSFHTPGTHTVRLRVTDADGGTGTTSRDVTVAGRAPTAQLTASPSAAFTDQAVILDASESADPDGSIVDYRWDLDDNGSFETGTGGTATLVRSFASAGRHTVRVRVTDNTGMEGTASVTVTVVERSGGGGPGGSSAGAAVAINGGARFTRRRAVTLNVLPAPGAATVEVSNRSDFVDSTTFPVSSSGRYAWRLDPSGSERIPKRVFVRFGGSLVADPGAVVSDTIVLDETRPRLLPPVLRRSASRAITAVRVSASDRTSGVRGVHVTTNRRRPGGLRRYRRVIAFRASRSSRVYVRAMDRAGNVSGWRRAR